MIRLTTLTAAIALLVIAPSAHATPCHKLVDHSAKYTPHGEVEVDTTWQAPQSQRVTVTMRVWVDHKLMINNTLRDRVSAFYEHDAVIGVDRKPRIVRYTVMIRSAQCVSRITGIKKF